jgi:ATP-dependent helicase HrpA
MTFRAVDHRGRTVGTSRDLADLQARLAGRAREQVARTLTRGARPAPRPGVGAAVGAAAPAVGERPPRQPSASGAASPSAPASRRGTSATSRGRGHARRRRRRARLPGARRREGCGRPAHRGDPERAARLTHAGVRRLLLLAVPSPSAYVLEHLTAAEKLSLAASPYPSAKALIEDARVAVADAVMARVAPGGVRTTAEFEAARDAFSAAVVDDLFQAVSLVARILTLQRDVERAVKRQNSMTLLAALGDVKGSSPGSSARLRVADGAGPSRPPPRYLQGRSRVEGLADNPGRDRQRMTEFERAPPRTPTRAARSPPRRMPPRSSPARAGSSRSTA